MDPISDCRVSHVGTAFQENETINAQSLEPCDPNMPCFIDFEKEINTNYSLTGTLMSTSTHIFTFI